MQDHLNMLVVEAQDRDTGMYLVLVPEGLDEAQMRSGFDEIGLEPTDVSDIRLADVQGWVGNRVRALFAVGGC